MPYELIKWIHLVGIISIFLSSGACAGYLWISTRDKGDKVYKAIMFIHAFGMLTTIISGFGLFGKLGYSFPYPWFVWGKLLLWVLIGGSIALITRLKKPMTALILTLTFGSLAALLGIFKNNFAAILNF